MTKKKVVQKIRSLLRDIEDGAIAELALTVCTADGENYHVPEMRVVYRSTADRNAADG
jgi:hypothetical protein